jgi:hypothetical protein
VPDYTGTFTGSFSGSFIGDGGSLTNVNYNTLANKPSTIQPFQGNSILANNAFRSNFNTNVKTRLDAENVISSSAQLTTEFDSRYGNELNDNLVSGSSQVSYAGLSNVPSGIVSSSSQVTITESQISDLQSYLTSLPSGTISSSAQVTITESQISDLQSYLTSETDSQTLSLSGNTLTISNGNSVSLPSSELPDGVVSSSAQITITESQISDLQSYLTSETDSQTLSISGNQLTISGGNVVTIPTGSDLPDGLVSGSVLRTLDGTGVISGSVLRTLDGTGVLSGSKTEIPAGTISSSAQITALGYSTTDSDDQTLTFNSVSKTLSISSGNSVDLSTLAGGGGGAGGSSIWTTGSSYYKVSADLQVTGSFGISGIPNVSASVAQAIAGNVLPNGTISGSSQITINESQISDLQSYLTSLPSGTVSGSSQVTITESQISDLQSYLTSLPSGTVSGSSQITITESQISNLQSYLTSVPAGTISSSAQITALGYSTSDSDSQELSISGNDLSISSGNTITLPTTSLPSGTVSGSSQITITESQISDLGTYLTSVPSGTVSGSTQITSVVTDSYISASAASSGFGAGGGVSDFTQLTNVPTGLVSSSNQITSVATASFVGGNVSSFDGNRIISNTDLPSNIYNVNFGTSGSVSNFIEKIFFPNTSPTISTTGFTLGEFVVSGSSVGTVSGTDAEGQSFTYRTASSYTSDFFRISSAGAITLNTKSTSSMNTDNTPGSGSHPFLVEAVDTFSGVGSKTIYIRVTPNTAPKWRQTSTGGSVVTSFTQSLNENSTAANNKVRVYFTDDESDTITIGSGSVPTGFTITKGSTYVQLNQTTASLDYETTPKYELVLTASDEHYVSGDDTDSISYLPFQIAVTDNTGPSVNDQTLSSINENSSDGTTVGSITATDPESDTIIFSNFTLQNANLDGGSDIKGTLGGNSLYDPHSDPFQCSSAGVVTRKNGVYLNSDVANRYIYQVTVTDAFNNTTDTANITIGIDDDVQSSISKNWTNLYIIESALTNSSIYLDSAGRSGTVGMLSSAVAQRWEVSSTNDLIKIDYAGSDTGSYGPLYLKSNLSGSGVTTGQTINLAITASEHGFETTKQFVDYTITVATNNSPNGTYTDTSANLNTNLGRSGSLITTLAWSDTEGDTINHSSFVFTDASGQLNSIQSGDSYLIQAKNNLSASNYTISGAIKDEHGFSTSTESKTITIAQSNTGTLGGDTTSYIIESGLNNESIRDASGFGAGNQSQMSVSYSPNYGSQAVQGSSWTSSNPAISINTSGQLSLAAHVSGSPSSSGDTFVSTIGFEDQYGNAGSGTVTVNVFANQAPTATFTNQTTKLNTDSALNNVTLVSMSISDTESDTPYSVTLSGTNASSLQLRYGNVNSSSIEIQSNTSLSAGTYTYNATVTDNFGKSQSYNGRTFTIAQSADYGKVYVYRSNFGSSAGLGSNYNGVMGISTVDSGTPPEVTAFTANSTSPMRLISSSLGDASLSMSGGATATRVAILSGSKLDTILNDAGPFTMGSTAEQYIVITPSGSDMYGVPTSVRDSFGGSTAGEFVMSVNADGGGYGIEATDIHQLDIEGSLNGYDKYVVIGRTGHNAAGSVYIRFTESSGSIPS